MIGFVGWLYVWSWLSSLLGSLAYTDSRWLRQLYLIVYWYAPRQYVSANQSVVHAPLVWVDVRASVGQSETAPANVNNKTSRSR